MQTLYRGSQQIKVEKEHDFFTAILKEEALVQQISGIPEVQQFKQVFQNVYKIKADASNRDGLMAELRSSMQTRAVFHHAYHPAGDQTTRYYLTDLVVVCFEPKTRRSTIERLMRTYGIHLVRAYDEASLTFLFRVTSSARKNPVKVTEALIEDPYICWAEPNLVNRFEPFHRPTDDLYANQWHLDSKTGIELVAEAGIQASKAWETTRGSRDIVVGVIDDGFDVYHPDFSATNKVVHAKDFADGDLYPFPKKEDGDYHGTPCAGVAIAEENGSGVVGIAPGCSFMPIRFDLAADDHTMFELFEYAGARADVLSCSWGPVPVNAPLPTLIAEQYARLSRTGGPRGKGCLICFAAGNYNAPIVDEDNESFTWRHPRYGLLETDRAILNGNAAHPDVVTVSASTSQNKKSAYSNWGAQIDVCAPSDNWHPLDPQSFQPGRGIWTTDNETFGLGFTPNSRYTSAFGGTSSATPLVAGLAALIRSANPELTALEVKELLTKTTDKITDTDPDPVLGNTFGSYDENGHSKWFGYGKINAAKAIAAAIEGLPEPEEEEDTSEPTVSQEIEGVSIVAAMVNPEGPEAGNEFVLLLNASPKPMDLSSCFLADQRGRTQALRNLVVEPTASITVILQSGGPKLVNTGGSIRLLDAQGGVIEEVRYTAEQGRKEGWLVVF